jgi:Chitobiase/beta-hexosaminidase C-terminal domain
VRASTFVLPFALCAAPSAMLGCAVGGQSLGNHDAVTADEGDETLTPIYEVGPGDDEAASTADGGEDTTTTTTTSPPPDGCVPSCTTCGATDGCGGLCKSGSCPRAGDVCTDGHCGCTPTCATCGASDGCGGTCSTGACGAAGEACIGGRCVAPTRSYGSPNSYAYTGGWARAFIAAAQSEAPATIFYTTDGSAPSASSPSKSNVVEASLSGGSLRWYADDGVAEGPQTLSIKVDTSLRTYYGFVVDAVRFTTGGGPVLVTSPGATVTGDAGYSIWSAPGCPACGLQVVYGIETDAQGCLYTGSPGVWPGASARSSFTLKAPSTAGTYHVTVTYTAQYTCAAALSTAPLGSRPTAQVAWLIVK